MATFEQERDHVGAGWQELIETVHIGLTALLGDYQLQQIKEKFGGLRYYYATDSTDQVMTDAARILVEEAEARSFRICEQCGADGATWSLRGWLVTLCEEHKAEREKEVEQRYQSLHQELGGEG